MLLQERLKQTRSIDPQLNTNLYSSHIPIIYKILTLD